ncbi:MAG: hypothetical protein WBF43_06335 [Methylocella sp.]
MRIDPAACNFSLRGWREVIGFAGVLAHRKRGGREIECRRRQKHAFSPRHYVYVYA